MSFSEKMRDVMNKGLESSRDLISKAGAQAQVWGEMGVLRVEIVQLRSQAEKLVAKLGTEAYAVLGERGEASLAIEQVRDLVNSIARTEGQIEEKESAYKKLGGKESDLDGEKGGS